MGPKALKDEIRTKDRITAKRDNNFNTLIQVFIFKRGEYLGWDCFQKAEISFGSTSNVDLKLDDQVMFAAKAKVNGDTVEIWNVGDQDNIFVNGKPITVCTPLGPFDHVSVGTYKLKIKANKQVVDLDEQVITDTSYNDPQKVKAKEAFVPHDRLIEDDTVQYDDQDCGESKDLSLELNLDEHPANIIEVPETDQEKEKKIEIGAAEESLAEAPQDETCPHNQQAEIVYEDEDEDEDDDEDDDDIELTFLKEELINCSNAAHLQNPDATKNGSYDANDREDTHCRLEIVKFRKDQVYDIQFLDSKKKYYVTNSGKKFCIAEYNAFQKSYIYYSPNYKIISYRNDKGDLSTEHFFDASNLYRKRKSVYRFQLRKNGEVVISDRYFDYRIRNMQLPPSTKVAEPPKEEPVFLNNIVKSAVVHLFFLLMVGFFFTFPEPGQQPEPVSRFVQIDTQQLKKKIQPPLPVKKKEIRKVEPQPEKVARVDKTKIKPKKAPKRKATKMAKQSRRTSKSSGRLQVARGKGNGNVSNPNIKQVGILGMLGNTVGITPNAAIAAVTNIDAVTSSHSNEANLKISGIVSELGDAGIQIPQGDAGVVNTKGSTQVLRSGGGSGKRTVGVLNNGGTGQGKVMGMVKVDVERLFRVSGGMSRAAVKRVIDQHLEELQFCYENATMANPSLMGGKITFEWKILMSGRVGEVSIKKSTIHSSDLHDCIKTSLKQWQFPKPKGAEVIVSYPLIFDTVGF